MGTFAILFQKDYLSNIKIYMALKIYIYWVVTEAAVLGAQQEAQQSLRTASLDLHFHTGPGGLET